ncbi:hypothetical protein [Aeromicrobium stalagmiti]|uniref:hypothetical protein n=1 Tax=Aeromicrobium stalagmiti TaxID=2738988 RepID=UPI001567CD89|nr:hypothetical protein [Aeromicrobium stalagmiti]NRQ48771.1 hypothetical protein [Aeromicrobium stalagmiti]
MKNARTFVVTGVAEGVVVAIYVLDRFADLDLGSIATILRIVLVVAAAVVAVVAYHAWSQRSSVHTICAMLLGLLGGASLVSAVSTAKGDEVYGSGAMALVGTVAVMLAVVVGQIAATRPQEDVR